jgi:hypothetical protein
MIAMPNIKEHYVYETLRKGDCLILLRRNNRFLVARNPGARIVLEWVSDG